jgi:phosphohistidine phosphatase
MKTLSLLRHAEAEINPEIADIERSLTKLGQSEVRSLSVDFRNKPKVFDLILCSPAQRTRETCQLFLDETGIKTPIILEVGLYNSSAKEIINSLSLLDNNINHLLVVGHNPSISEVANFLLDPLKKQISFGTANMAKLFLDIDSWSEITKHCADISCFI